MKKSAFFAIALFILPFAVQAQLDFGIRAGLSSYNLDRESVSQNGLSVAIKDANYGYHLGFFTRATVGQIYLQPEFLFNSNTVDYEVNEFGEGLMSKVLREKYQNLDIPVMVGYKLGPLRLEAGPVGHVYIASKTELDEINGYDQRFNNFNLGYQAGLGLDLWKLLLDVRYEGSFNDFGEHMYIGGQQVNFSQNPSRVVMTLGYRF